MWSSIILIFYPINHQIQIIMWHTEYDLYYGLTIFRWVSLYYWMIRRNLIITSIKKRTSCQYGNVKDVMLILDFCYVQFAQILSNNKSHATPLDYNPPYSLGCHSIFYLLLWLDRWPKLNSSQIGEFDPIFFDRFDCITDNYYSIVGVNDFL